MICNTPERVSMKHSRILFLAALGALAACQPKSGVTTADASPPVATVDGSPISRDFYEFYIKGITSKSSSELTRQEYHARHILVATEPFAEKLVTRLDKGEKFDVLAKQESMDPSKSNGGDLGWFSPDRMVPEFAGALIALKPGEYTHKPIQTQYGWHIIQLLETRALTPPSF